MRILVLVRGYPEADDLYNYPFVHRRVVQYLRAGHQVLVFTLGSNASFGVRKYDNVDVEIGGAGELHAVIAGFGPDCIAAHGMADDTWEVLADVDDDIPIFGWMHGSEILPIYMTVDTDRNSEKHQKKKKIYLQRLVFWRGLLQNWPRNLKLVFVSENAMQRANESLGVPIPKSIAGVTHNPIDTDLFSYSPKSAAQRFDVLSIRPFNSMFYGNDLTVKAIEILSEHALFPKFKFTLIGDGDLFVKTVSPLRAFENVHLQQRFLEQAEIAQYHRKHGIFLVPTREDTQGVSRDEAMSSGLVPVTNAVSAIPEFVSSDCGCLAANEDAAGLANCLIKLAQDPDYFLALSKNAAKRVRRQSGSEIIIPKELNLMATGEFDV